MQTIKHISFENLTFRTRQQARNEKKYRASIGQVATLVDNGIEAGKKRWVVVVEVTKTITKGFKRVAKKAVQVTIRPAFEVRKPSTGLSGYNVYYNGVFLFNRDKKYQAIQHAQKIGHSMNLHADELKQLRGLR